MAAIAIELRFVRIIKAARAVPGHAAQEEGVIMILAAEKVLVPGQFDRQADLVASGAELRLFVQRLQESLFVELRFGLDQLLVDKLQDAIAAVSERIMDRLINGVIAIAARAVDVRHRVTTGAGESGLGRG